MELVVRNKKRFIIKLITFVIILLIFIITLEFNNRLSETEMVMGGKFYNQVFENTEKAVLNNKADVEKYYRPSKLPVQNVKYDLSFIDKYFGKKYSQIKLLLSLFKTPEDTIMNYFSILRDAANPQEGKNAGCGTIGNATLPYPVAYNFLSSEYQKKLSYEQYLKTFENILHISLIKYKEIPVYNNLSNIVRYFVEIETIEGSEKEAAYFAYYYGFVDLIKEGNGYKISDVNFYGENYLCAPMHGWSYNAEAVVDVKYGGWCSLVKKRHPTQQKDYIKKIYFKGTDGYDYLIEFFQLTNDTDIEIAQFRKGQDKKWKLIKLEPEKCLK